MVQLDKAPQVQHRRLVIPKILCELRQAVCSAMQKGLRLAHARRLKHHLVGLRIATPELENVAEVDL